MCLYVSVHVYIVLLWPPVNNLLLGWVANKQHTIAQLPSLSCTHHTTPVYLSLYIHLSETHSQNKICFITTGEWISTCIVSHLSYSQPDIRLEISMGFAFHSVSVFWGFSFKSLLCDSFFFSSLLLFLLLLLFIFCWVNFNMEIICMCVLFLLLYYYYFFFFVVVGGRCPLVQHAVWSLENLLIWNLIWVYLKSFSLCL